MKSISLFIKLYFTISYFNYRTLAKPDFQGPFRNRSAQHRPSMLRDGIFKKHSYAIIHFYYNRKSRNLTHLFYISPPIVSLRSSFFRYLSFFIIRRLRVFRHLAFHVFIIRRLCVFRYPPSPRFPLSCVLRFHYSSSPLFFVIIIFCFHDSLFL